MKTLEVGIADYKVSSDPDTVIVTHSLGSCIAVIVWDPTTKIGGMLHYMLPSSKTSPEKAKTYPAMFADTGIPLLFRTMYRLGAKREHLLVKLVGGASTHNTPGPFSIGRRNHEIARKMLESVGFRIVAEDVGEHKSRSAWLYLSSGKVLIKSMGEEYVI